MKVTVIQLASRQLVTAHNTVTWAPIKETQSFQNDVSEVLLRVARKRGYEIPVSTEERLMSRLKRERERKRERKKGISPLSGLQAPQPRFGIQSEFQALLVQGSAQAAEWSSGPFVVHCSWRFTRLWDSVVWRRLHSHRFKVIQVLDLLSICKNGPWDFGFFWVPYLFLNSRFQFPFWKALSNFGFDGHSGVYEYFRGKLLAMVCTLAKTLCFTRLLVFPWPSAVFSFPYLSLSNLPFLHSLHCDCSARTRLKKKRCLSFFYCIILPFDLVMLIRMSYNVESAKSVLFSHVCNLSRNVNDFLCNTHITKITKKALHGK